MRLLFNGGDRGGLVVLLHVGLGSFFEGHVDRSKSLTALSDKLLSIANEQMQPVVMVTHQVVISAITGLGTSSGEAILYDPSHQQAIRIRLSSSD